MSYPSKSAKNRLDLQIDSVKPGSLEELSYVVTKLTLNFLDNSSGVGYGSLIATIGAINDSADEVRRRIKDPLVKGLIRSSGDPFFEFIKKHNLPTL